ncbi:hypothetical protein BS47DRAFT_293791 [Hydnum rufescens UP504]|uniref:Uncharacterized protein n=1 Tax=Hydnum rufescens UP504 TaxID=1448309 RepID=A0A9P6B5Z8_9AGAM|nr:hypothetical protein BS47DRAFT_293791 [Hydnum rufescens UP504]
MCETYLNVASHPPAEERQDQNAKRRKIEDSNRLRPSASSPALSMQATSYVPFTPLAPPSESPIHHSLPARPAFDIFTGPVEEIPSPGSFPPAEGAKALGGSNADVVNNRRAIRMANMSAAEHLKAELAGLVPLGRNASKRGPAEATKPTTPSDDSNIVEDHPSLPVDDPLPPQLSDNAYPPQDHEVGGANPEIPSDGPRGHKRKIDEVEEVDPASVDDILEPDISEDVDEDQADVPSKARVVNPDGTVDQVDTVRCAIFACV